MRPNNPPFKPLESREERESRIKDFIRDALDETATGRADAIALLARSPESPAVAALLAMTDELAERRIGAVVVLAGGSAASEDETWNLSFNAKFVHEIRLTSNPRLLDGHEQLIIGDTAVWYGDCMRRDPLKRDAFSAFCPNDRDIARAGRFAFANLWQRAQSIYRNAALSSVVVTTRDVAGEQTLEVVPTGSIDTLSQRTANGSSIAETLAAWQPSTRH